MPQQRLTDRVIAPYITGDTLIHIVNTGDTTQYAGGSSYKATIDQVATYISQNYTMFSGGSGNCITDLYVSNIHSCSPLNINPLDEGNVYFGSTSAVTIDLVNERVGIGTTIPTEKLHISGNTKIDIITTGNTDGLIINNISGSTRSQIVLKSDDTFLWRFGLTSGTGNTSFNFYNGINDVLTINKDLERVGIGVNPNTFGTQAKLHINNTTSGNTFLAEDSTNPDSSPFVIDSLGNVGIGISGTTFKLDVNGTTIHRDNVLISNSKEIFWSDTSTTWPTSINNRIRWTLNNDSAQVYAFQPETDDVDFVFKITDNATDSRDNFVFWIEDFSGETFDRYPLEINSNAVIVNPTRRYALSASTSASSVTNFYVLKSGATSTSSSILHANTSTDRVGVNTSSPSETLDVNGKTKTINFQMTSGATDGYVLTSDASGNASWGELSSLYTGNTSGDCITDLYVSNIHSCSPLNINPLDEGNVYFGSTSGITVDVTNKRIGIGTNTPSIPLDVILDASSPPEEIARFGISDDNNSSLSIVNSTLSPGQFMPGILGVNNTTDRQGLLFYGVGGIDSGTNPITQFSSNILISGSSYTDYGFSGVTTRPLFQWWNYDEPKMTMAANGNLGIGTTTPEFKLDALGSVGRFYVSLDDENLVATSLSGSSSGQTDISVVSPGSGLLQIGIIGSNVTGTTFAGKVKDSYIYSSVANNGLNLVSAPGGGGFDDYIRFYAGQFGQTGNTPDIHIQGSGTTRGYVGIGTGSPTSKLNISGSTGFLNYDSDGVLDVSRQSYLKVSTPSASATTAMVVNSGDYSLEFLTIGTGTTTTYGSSGDSVIYASSLVKNLNIINGVGLGPDNIRFYAGQIVSTGTTPDLHIQGNGATRGYVGIGTESPSEKLDVSGKTKTTNFQMTSGATSGYVLTSDASGNASWQNLYGYQYFTAVTITSAQTLSIGSIPVQILPAPGTNKYYDFKVLFEYVFNTTAYSSTGTLVLVDNTTKRVTNQFDIHFQPTSRVLVSDMNCQNQLTTLNSQIDFTTSNGLDPTLGDGSLKVKIYYNIIDFG